MKRTMRPTGDWVPSYVETHLFDTVTEATGRGWYGRVSPTNLIEVANITARQLHQRALETFGHGMRTSDQKMKTVYQEGAARDTAAAQKIERMVALIEQIRSEDQLDQSDRFIGYRYELFHEECDSFHTIGPRPFTCLVTGDTFQVGARGNPNFVNPEDSSTEDDFSTYGGEPI